MREATVKKKLHASIPMLLKRANRSLEMGFVDEAEQLCRSVIASAPRNVSALHMLSFVCLERGSNEEAISLAECGLSIEPSNTNLLFILSEAHRRSGNIELALDMLRRLIKIQPNNIQALANLGGLLVDIGSNEEAITILKRAVGLQHGFAEAENNLATALTKLGRNEEALEHYRNALTANPDAVDTLDNIGNTYAQLGRMNEALAAYQKSLIISPMRYATLVRAGDLYYDTRCVDEALACYRKAIDLDPNAHEALAGMGVVLHDLGRLDQAMECLAKACAAAPQRADLMIWLGWVLADMNRSEESGACAARAKTMLTDAGTSDFELGKLFAAVGERIDAEYFLRRYLEYDPTDKKGAVFILASIGVTDVPSRTERTYLCNYYDAARAEGWDSNKHNRPPQLVVDMVESQIHEMEQIVVLDLGCGTGRIGELLGSRVGAIDGVDISPEMLRKAHGKGCYRNLFEQDLVSFLDHQGASYDLIVAAAAFIYFSDLRVIFSLSASVLRDGGLMIFTLLKGDSIAASGIAEYHGHVMDGCFCHAPDDVRRMASECGFEVLRVDENIHEYNRLMNPIPGLVVALRRVLNAKGYETQETR